MEITLGRTYRDTVTGFVGIATSHCRYLTGPDRVGLASKVNDRGEFCEPWFDVPRLALVETPGAADDASGAEGAR